MNPKTALTAAALAAFLVIARVGTADGPAPVTAALQGDPARPASAQHWLRSELYFGVGPVDVQDGGVSEMQWRAFLDREVTPRFQNGLTVLDAYGQWRGGGRQAPSRLRSKVLVIVHDDTPANRDAIDAIRLAWKAATHAQSVLVASEPVEVSF
jgi:hypothetical protein